MTANFSLPPYFYFADVSRGAYPSPPASSKYTPPAPPTASTTLSLPPPLAAPTASRRLVIMAPTDGAITQSATDPRCELHYTAAGVQGFWNVSRVIGTLTANISIDQLPYRTDLGTNGNIVSHRAILPLSRPTGRDCSLIKKFRGSQLHPPQPDFSLNQREPPPVFFAHCCQ